MMTSTEIVRSVTGAEVEHFEQYGFVRLKRILADEEIERLRRATAVALGTLEASPSHRDLTLRARAAERANTRADTKHIAAKVPAPFPGAQFGSVRDRARDIALAEHHSVPSAGHFLTDSGVWRRNEAICEFALRSELPQIAAGLMGAYAVRFYDDQLVLKEPDTAERTAFHQDLSYLHIDGDKGCVFWVFLDRARRGLGRIGYVPSSHRWGHVFKPNNLISESPCPGAEGADMPGIESAPDSFGVQYIDIDPGDILVHHVLTLHGMEGNRGTAPCRALGFCYVDAALHHRLRPGVAISPSHNRAARDGSEMDAKAHPIVWPRFESEALAG